MSIAGVLSSWAFAGLPVTAPPPVCVPAVIGALAVWRQNKTQIKKYIGNVISKYISAN